MVQRDVTPNQRTRWITMSLTTILINNGVEEVVVNFLAAKGVESVRALALIATSFDILKDKKYCSDRRRMRGRWHNLQGHQ